MEQHYKFRSVSSIVGFIDFFLTTLAIFLLLGGIFLLPNSHELAENISRNYSTFVVLTVWILIIIVWAVMWIGAVKLVKATVGKIELAESIGRIIVWRNANICVVIMLIVGSFFNGRNNNSFSWVPQIVHILFRVFGLSIVCIHLSELRETVAY